MGNILAFVIDDSLIANKINSIRKPYHLDHSQCDIVYIPFIDPFIDSVIYDNFISALSCIKFEPFDIVFDRIIYEPRHNKEFDTLYLKCSEESIIKINKIYKEILKIIGDIESEHRYHQLMQVPATELKHIITTTATHNTMYDTAMKYKQHLEGLLEIGFCEHKNLDQYVEYFNQMYADAEILNKYIPFNNLSIIERINGKQTVVKKIEL